MKQADGSVMVYGQVTDDLLDYDGQIVDAPSAAKCLNEWFDDHGNIRQQHSALLAPAGKALTLEYIDEIPYLKGLIVEPTAVKLVDLEVYKGWSVGIGIYDLVPDPRAPEGRIIPKMIHEVSLVDFPANPRCKAMVAKRLSSGEIEIEDQSTVLIEADGTETPWEYSNEESLVKMLTGKVEKKDLSSAEMNDLPDSAFAYIEPGGEKDQDGKTTPRSKRHFAIHDKAHVQNALARVTQSPFGDKAMPKIKTAAEKFGVEVSEKGASKMAKKSIPDGQAQCPTCDGEGKIKEGNVDCPPSPDGCGGSGHVPEDSPILKKGVETETDKLVDDGAEKAKGKGGEDDEVDTDKDGVPDVDEKVDSKIDAVDDAVDDLKGAQAEDDDAHTSKKGSKKGLVGEAPFVAQRLHDMLCPGFGTAAVKSAYLDDGVELPVADIVDPSFFADRLAELGKASGRPDDITAEADAYAAAHKVASLKAPAFEEMRDAASKAFENAYPDVHLTPKMISPDDFKRPFLAGANSETSSKTSVAMPEAHPIAPTDFQRGPLSANETRPSLTGGESVAKARNFYTNSAKDEHAGAMAVLHDHIVSSYPGVCPVEGVTVGLTAAPHDASGQLGQPNAMNALPKAGGSPIDTKAGATLEPVSPSGANKGAGSAPFDTALMKQLVAEEVEIAVEPMRAENRKLKKRLNKALNEPDPRQAAFRGSSPLQFGGIGKQRADGAETEERVTAVRNQVAMLKSRIKSGNSAVSGPAQEQLRELVSPQEFADIVTADSEDE